MLVFCRNLHNKLINMYAKLHHFSKSSALGCAAMYHNFYIKLAIFLFRMLLKYTLKRINYNMFSKNKFHRELSTYPIASV